MSRHYKPMSPARRDARWESRALEAEASGDPLRTDADFRRPCVLDLRGAGGRLLYLTPAHGKCAWEARDESGAVVGRAAIKTLLHDEAARLVRMGSPSRWH